MKNIIIIWAIMATSAMSAQAFNFDCIIPEIQALSFTKDTGFNNARLSWRANDGDYSEIKEKGEDEWDRIDKSAAGQYLYPFYIGSDKDLTFQVRSKNANRTSLIEKIRVMRINGLNDIEYGENDKIVKLFFETAITAIKGRKIFIGTSNVEGVVKTITESEGLTILKIKLKSPVRARTDIHRLINQLEIGEPAYTWFRRSVE